MEDMATEYSFYELINKKELVIEIPKVQRDYAQGRNNDYAKRVLRDLLQDIKTALNEAAPPLKLQFVYGKKENGRFIPIDGQQRLTTLFLLHVYAFRNDASKDEILKRFSYETRHTSREFVYKLVENRAEIFKERDEYEKEEREKAKNMEAKNKDEKKTMEDFIVDFAWFNSLAINDPTVLAMINALDMIYEEFHAFEDLDIKLMDVENKKIIFNFLDMKELGMEDSLYIKLNARGKQLTKFENFKASLFERLDEIGYTPEEKNEFLSKFDNSWTDIFWQLSLDGSNQKDYFDTVFERFFKVLLVNLEILTQRDKEKEIDILGISLPEVREKIDKDLFDTLKWLLDYLANEKNQNTSEYEEIYNKTIAVLKKDLTHEDMVLFHMTMCFVRECQGDVANYRVAYRRWTRVFKNLIYNTAIDEEERRKRAINSINAFASHWKDVYQFMQYNKVAFFDTNQVEEEKEKIKLILEEENSQKTEFVNAIYFAEEQKYFQGQIRSALYRSYDTSRKVYDVNKFQAYWNAINLLFGDAKPKNGMKLCRTLLCYGDYRLPVKSYHTLCVDGANDSAGTPSMKNLFSMNHISEQTKQDKIVSAFMEDLVNKNVSNVDELENALDDIINNKKTSIQQDDWRWCLVNYEKHEMLFKFMQKRRMRNDYGEELLIRNTSSSGLNPNVFLMVVGLKIGKDATDANNYPTKGIAYEHPLYFSYKNGEWLYVLQDYGKFSVNGENSGMIKEFSGNTMIDDVVNFCKTL